MQSTLFPFCKAIVTKRLLLLFIVVCLYAQPSAGAYTDTLNWMGHWYHTDLRYALVLDVKQEYEFLHQNVRVNLEFPEELFGTNSKILAAKRITSMIRTGVYDFDVIWMDDNLYQFVAKDLGDPLWGRKYLVDFSEVKGFAATQKSFIIQDKRYRDQTGGILVGPYLEGYLYALYFNQAVAKRIGIEIKRYGATFEDLLGYVAMLGDYNRRTGNTIAAFYESGDWLTLEILFQNLIRSLIPEADLKDGRNGAAADAALRRALEAFERLSRHHPLIASHERNIWFETIDIPLKGECLFFVNGTWMYSRWRAIDSVKTVDMVPAELPVLRPASCGLGGYIPTWAVFKNAPHRDRGVELLMQWSRPKVAEQWVRNTKTPTGLRGHLVKPSLGSDPYEVFQNTMTAAYGNHIYYTYTPAYIPGIRPSLGITYLSRVLRDVLTGKINATEAYNYLKEAP